MDNVGSEFNWLDCLVWFWTFGTSFYDVYIQDLLVVLYLCLGPSYSVLHPYMPSCYLCLVVIYRPLYFIVNYKLSRGSLQGDEKYRCSETGYRIPFKCEESKGSKKDAKKTRTALEISSSIAKSHKVSHVSGVVTTSRSHRTLLDDSLASNNQSQAYVTYRSCIPADSEEKLSVLGFEVIFSYQLRFIVIFSF